MENLRLNNSQGWEKEKKQGLDNNQGWEKEKTQGLLKNKAGISIISPNKNPGVCIRQLRVPSQRPVYGVF